MNFVITEACENPNCTFSENNHIVDAISKQAASQTASILNSTRHKNCPLCGEELGYFWHEKL